MSKIVVNMSTIQMLQRKLCRLGGPTRNFKRFFNQDQRTADLPRQSCCDLSKTKKLMSYGQPIPGTHPHLLKENEVTPGITKAEFQARRTKLMELIGQRQISTCHHLVIIPSASKVYMSDKIPYVFRQDSDFLYLSGFLEPDSVLVLHNLNESECSKLPSHKSVIFLPKKDKNSELWDGPSLSNDDSVSTLGVDEAYNISELDNYLEKTACRSKSLSVWCAINQISKSPVNHIVNAMIKDVKHSYFDNPTSMIHQLRLIKSDAEIKLIKESCEIASHSLTNVIQASHPMISEKLLSAKMEYECKIRGADYLSFPPVVAGGTRANTIHYIQNNQLVQPHEMVLMDAGCEHHGYSSDFTRTWPVSGKFTPPQREIYEAVLAVQNEMIGLCREFLPLDVLFHKMSQSIGTKLLELSILPGDLSRVEFSQLAYQHCPHHVSHYLGMDVHDTPSVSRSIPLQPGMVITIEPGIYVPTNCKHAPTRFQGVGVRIEDDILITEKGPVVLTKSCPKEIAEIEKLFGQANNS